MTKFADMVRAFAREEDGIALTEYLILLGILTGGVVASVLIVGTQLSSAWGTWSTWFTSVNLDAPA